MGFFVVWFVFFLNLGKKVGTYLIAEAESKEKRDAVKIMLQLLSKHRVLASF